MDADAGDWELRGRRRDGGMTQSPAEDALIEVVLAALADPTRRRILDGLSAAGGGTATTLAQDLPVTRQAVVKHLTVLHQAGLVVARKTGREVRYSVAPAPLETTARWMSELASEWDKPLQAVKRLAESAE
jgi:DNA-binding transcriptional ArsR family regulator